MKSIDECFNIKLNTNMKQSLNLQVKIPYITDIVYS